MKVDLTTDQMSETDAALLIVPVRKGRENPAFQALDQACDGALSACAKQEKFNGQKDRTLIWQGTVFGRSLKIMGVGTHLGEAEPTLYRLAVARGIRHAAAHCVQKVAVYVDGRDDGAQVAQVRLAVEAAVLSAYRFSKHKTQKTRETGFPKSCAVGVFPEALNQKACAAALKQGKAAAGAVNLTRDLVNEPANALSPDDLGKRAMAMAKQKGLTCTVLETAAIRKLGMNLFLSVAGGSHRQPRFIHLTYTPKKKTSRRIALVGKGVTFDTGGLCIKPGKSMYTMNTDMAGAAVVLGVMSALKEMAIPVEVHGIIPATDNSVGPDSTRPGDVFKSLSGKTVEVVNTDAEGRLILADALTYACDLEPELIIDHATLTGACEVALGSYTAGLFSKRDVDAEAYLAAADRAGELLWRLPLSEELESGLKSDVADLKNVGPRWGGAISASLFLQHFTADVPWMHLDIAGPARSDKNTPLGAKGGTGFGVLTALSFLSD